VVAAPLRLSSLVAGPACFMIDAEFYPTGGGKGAVDQGRGGRAGRAVLIRNRVVGPADAGVPAQPSPAGRAHDLLGQQRIEVVFHGGILPRQLMSNSLPSGSVIATA
jgi:hypothetical protein